MKSTDTFRSWRSFSTYACGFSFDHLFQCVFMLLRTEKWVSPVHKSLESESVSFSHFANQKTQLENSWHAIKSGEFISSWNCKFIALTMCWRCRLSIGIEFHFICSRNRRFGSTTSLKIFQWTLFLNPFYHSLL